MATIPIEIILQDAEAPVDPTPTPEEETNIVVPDTGTISNEKDSGGISSSVGIILPIVMVILAIVTVTVLMVRRHHNKHFPSVMNKKEKLATVASSTIAILAITVLVGNLVIPATKAATSDIADGITPTEDKISIVVTRDGGSAEASIESTATITSTSDFGYKVLLSMAEGVETANLYLNGDETSEYYIAPVEVSDDENEAEGTVLADNTWGYALTEDGEYSAMPLLNSAATVAQGDEPVEDGVLSIYYGVKVSNDLAAGIYSGGEVEYGPVAIEPTISNLTYMQDFAKLSESGKASVLRSMIEDEQYTLKDSRDKKDYFIAKLADGNVWMTQNLDLDLKTDGSIVYDSTNTNLPANTTWEPERATIAKDGLSSTTWPEDEQTYYRPYSYDPGYIYYYTSGSNANDTKYESLEACTGANHTEADCRHYHAGNYYSWSAAVASNDTSSITTQYTNAETSICPAGWRLPRGRSAESITEGNEFDSLVSSYEGIVSEPVIYDGGANMFRNYLSGGFNAVRIAPLWLVRSGNIAYGGTSSAGSLGYYRSSTNDDDRYAYSLDLGFSMITPSESVRNSYGNSVRCVAQ